MASKCTQRIIEDKKPDGFTAMHIAAINNHADVARALVQKVIFVYLFLYRMHGPISLFN